MRYEREALAKTTTLLQRAIREVEGLLDRVEALEKNADEQDRHIALLEARMEREEV